MSKNGWYPKSSQIRPLCFWNLWFWGPPVFRTSPQFGTKSQEMNRSRIDSPHVPTSKCFSSSSCASWHFESQVSNIIYIYTIYTIYNIYIYILPMFYILCMWCLFFSTTVNRVFFSASRLGIKPWPSFYSHNRQRQMWIYIYKNNIFIYIYTYYIYI